MAKNLIIIEPKTENEQRVTLTMLIDVKQHLDKWHKRVHVKSKLTWRNGKKIKTLETTNNR